MSNKRTLKYAVECKNKFETNKVAGYFKRINKSNDLWPHFKYVLSHVDGYHNSIFYDGITYIPEDYSIISFKEWKKLPEDFTLENSGVRGSEDLRTYCKNKEIKNIEGSFPDQQYWVQHNKWVCSERIYKNIIPLSLYLQLIEQQTPSTSVNLQIEQTRKILGYKLTKEEYREAASKIAGIIIREDSIDYEFQSMSPMHRKIEKSGVLDLWFEPVYEPEFLLPKIGGQSGKVVGDYLVYGCQKVHLSLFDINNCDFRSINIYSIIVDISTIEQIRNYLTENKINFKF